MASWLFVSVCSSLVAIVHAGSGCNEVIDDPGPWVSQLEMQQTEEGFELMVHLVGGDVASSSMESVELMISIPEVKQKHFVLQKAGTRKGGIMEIRTEEKLLPKGTESMEMKVTLAEYNGNSHGPQNMRCSVRPQERQHYSCLSVEKAVSVGASTQAPAPMGGSEHMASGHMHGTGGMGHMDGMNGGMGASGHMRGQMPHQSPEPQSATRQAMTAAMALHLGDACIPSHNSAKGFTCQERSLRLETAAPDSLISSLRMALTGVLALFLCLCLLGWFYRKHTRDLRTFDELPKVMGKTNLDLPTLKPRKYIEASDSDEEYRTF
eukprot:symbB.v1.2.031516.t1/scaffold3666.1/size52310/2